MEMQVEALNTNTERPSTPSGRPTLDDIPPTPVSMPSPSQQRPPLDPPLVPRHTRPNVAAKRYLGDSRGSNDDPGSLVLGPEDVQTVAIADDLFAMERPVAVTVEESAPRAFRGYSRGRYRGRGRGLSEGRGRGRGRG